MKKIDRSNDKKRFIPLSSVMIIIVFFMWFFPVTSIFGFFLSNTLNNTYENFLDVMATSVENILNSIKINMDFIVADSINGSYVPTIRNAYSKYLEDENDVDFYSEIVGFLQERYSKNQMVPSVHLVFPDISNMGNTDYFIHNSLISTNAEAKKFYTNGAYEKAVKLIDTLDSNVDFVESDGKVYLVRVLSLQQNSIDPYAVMVSEINTEILFGGLLEHELFRDISVGINDANIDILGESMPINRKMDSDTTQINMEKNGFAVIDGSITSERYTMFFKVKADVREMISSIGQNIKIFVWFFVLSVPLAFAIILFFSRKVSGPINKLSSLAQNIEQGNFGVQINADTLGSSEFGFLGVKMNGMSAKLKDQFERLYREELALRDARIDALQSQINPHFLGNTLEIINWEARLAGDAKVCRMLESLSTMLEAVIKRDTRPLVHLSEEMMYVNAYLYIVSERLGKRMQVEMDIDNELLDWYVPRLILQPIVENAYEHGVVENQKGTITIRAEKIDDDWMKIEVINDSPLSPEDQQRISTLLGDNENSTLATSQGIRNVNQRLILLYGEKARLIIQNNEINYTISSFCICNKQKEQDQSI